MGLFDSILGSVMGGAANQSGLQSVLMSALSGGGQSGGQPGAGGIGGLIETFGRAGLGNVVNSWIGNGPNQPVDPQQIHQAFGQQQVSQWAQQAGVSQDTVLSALSKMLPHAVDQMTPNGTVPAATDTGASPFDEPGLEMPQR